MFGKKEKTIS